MSTDNIQLHLYCYVYVQKCMHVFEWCTKHLVILFLSHYFILNFDSNGFIVCRTKHVFFVDKYCIVKNFLRSLELYYGFLGYLLVSIYDQSNLAYLNRLKCLNVQNPIK